MAIIHDWHYSNIKASALKTINYRIRVSTEQIIEHKYNLNSSIALCRDLSTRHLDGQKQIWTGRNIGGWVVEG